MVDKKKWINVLPISRGVVFVGCGLAPDVDGKLLTVTYPAAHKIAAECYCF